MISFYKTKNSGSGNKNDFMQITLGDIPQLPILRIDFIEQLPLIKLVNIILSEKKINPKANTEFLEGQIDQLVL